MHMTSIYEKNILAEVWPIHAQQRLQHRWFPVKFVKLSRTVVNVGHTLAIFNAAVLLLYCNYC